MKIRKSIGILSILGLALAAPIQTTASQKVKYLDDLVVNTSQDYRTVVIESEEEGVEEMKVLAENSTMEEVWAYIPKKTMWIEIGKNEKKIGMGDVAFYRVDLDEEYLKELIKEHDELILYHFHPDAFASYISRKEKNPVTEQELLEIRRNTLVSEALPSIYDLSSMIEASEEFYKLKPNGKISEKQLSLHGISEYHITEQGKEYFKDKSKDAIFAELMFARKKAFPYLENPNSKEAQIGCINGFLRMLNIYHNGNIRISFTSHDK